MEKDKEAVPIRSDDSLQGTGEGKYFGATG